MGRGTAVTSAGLRRSPPRTRVRLCGALALEIDGRDALAPLPAAGQARLLLARLLAAPDRSAGREELIDVLWPRDAPKEPAADLRAVLSRVRRAIAPARLEGRARLTLVLPGPVWIDADAATAALAAARTAAADGAWGRVSAHAERARDLLEGDFLAGQDGEWARERRRELHDLEVEALEWAARAGLAAGGAGLTAARRAARELVARAPLRESAHGLLMEALAAGGDAAEALAAYAELRRRLRDELGTVPGPELQALHVRLLAEAAAQPSRTLPASLQPGRRDVLVARDAQLARLRAAWREARAGRRRIVALRGEAGIGKTSLAARLAREAHADGTVLYAACQPEALVPYQPFVEALRHYAETLPAGSPPFSLGPGGAELAGLVGGLPVAAPAEPAVPIATAGDTGRWLLFEAVRSLLGQAAAREPLLLVLDDLHWADRPTLHLLRHVVGDQEDAALLVVATFREDEVGAGGPLAELVAGLRRDPRFEQLTLGGLDVPGVASLLAGHAGQDVPDELARLLHDETAGNPFFVEEVMRHLIETGVVREADGGWSSERMPERIGVPDGVREVIGRRLSRLSPPCRAALDQAAVLGREPPFDVLARMVDGGEEAAVAAVEDAVAAQLLVEVRRDGETRYAFAHALVRETLYVGLSLPRRQRLHAQAAAAIAASGAGSDASVGALALHWRLAGPAADAGQALDASLRAGARARELFAWEEAIEHWDGALAIMERTGAEAGARARLLVALAALAAVTGDLARQIAWLERALALHAGRGDDEAAARVHSRLGMAHSLIDATGAEHLDIRRAFVHYDAARSVLARGPAGRARGHLETGVATAMTYALRCDEGLEASARGMEIAERVGDEALWAAAAQAHAWHTIIAGAPDDGFAEVDLAFAAADRGRRPFLAWMGGSIRGQMTWGLGDPDGAQPFFERTLVLPYAGETVYRRELLDGLGRCHLARAELAEARRLRQPGRPAWISYSLPPLIDLWEGDWAAVEGLARRTYATSRRTGNRWDEWAALSFAGRVRRLRGRPAEAVALLARAQEIVRDGGAVYFEMWVLPELARALAEAGDPAGARGHVARMEAILAAGQDWRGRRGEALLADAVVLSHERRDAAANARFAEALDVLRRYRLVRKQADALHEWGRALARAGDATGARERLAPAAALYRRHRAGEAWLDRVRRDVPA